MKTLLVFLYVSSILSANANAETYSQCKKRILADITKYEQTGKTVTQQNKDLSVQAHCDRFKTKEIVNS